MKTEKHLLPIILLMAAISVTSCDMGVGDRRNSNLAYATRTYLDDMPDMEYIGMSDVHELNSGTLQAVVIYYVTDSGGNKIERNARVVTNGDCSEIYSWENLDSNIYGETKQKVVDKLEGKGIRIDGSLIDALIELKKR